ncbi:MAG: DUF2442 domain-containing protein [Deltaproteobacteria bacterium]|nr:DUF2442 domain-containing protein [Deltaproteobacteria bacterium]
MSTKKTRRDYSPVVAARPLGAHRVWLQFADGLTGELDLRSELWGAIFEPLVDPAYFARLFVDRTLCWPNGADFSPEYLWDRVRFETFGIKPARKYADGFPTSSPPLVRRPHTVRARKPATAPAKKRTSRRRA